MPIFTIAIAHRRIHEKRIFSPSSPFFSVSFTSAVCCYIKYILCCADICHLFWYWKRILQRQKQLCLLFGLQLMASNTHFVTHMAPVFMELSSAPTSQLWLIGTQHFRSIVQNTINVVYLQLKYIGSWRKDKHRNWHRLICIHLCVISGDEEDVELRHFEFAMPFVMQCENGCIEFDGSKSACIMRARVPLHRANGGIQPNCLTNEFSI